MNRKGKRTYEKKKAIKLKKPENTEERDKRIIEST